MTYDPLAIGRVVVVQPEPPAELADAKLEVGLLGWRGPEPRLAVVAKTTLSYERPEGAPAPAPGEVELVRFAPDPAPLSLGQPSAPDEARPDEARYPSDFVPRKAAVDVLLVGHAYASAVTSRIDGQVAVGSWGRFFAVEGGPGTAIPLCADNFLPSNDSLGEPMAPLPLEPFERERTHAEDFDFRAYNSAVPRQRAQELLPDAVVRLVGLSAVARERTLKLPGLIVQARVEAAGLADRNVELYGDTLWIDTDQQRVVLVWRGDVALLSGAREVTRVVVTLEQLGRERDWNDRLRYCQRGRVHYAVRAEDLAPEAPPIPTNDESLQIARYQTWVSPAPEPKLPLERYAVISAELCEWPERRAATLERHHLDEDRFVVEERAWLEKMSIQAQSGDALLAAEYGDKLMAAQDALATPEELERTARDYAYVLIEIENNYDVPTVLREQGMTLPAWLRLDRRFTKARATDAALDGEIEQACAEWRAARAERAEPPELGS